MKKRILGIAVLLAVVAMGLTFTACPPDNDVREVTFINQTKIQIRIKCEGIPLVTLPAAELKGGKIVDGEKSVSSTGKDIVIEHITFDDDLVQLSPTTYLTMTGSATGGKPVADGVSLKSGILYFTALSIEGGNHIGFKISTIPLDE